MGFNISDISILVNIFWYQYQKKQGDLISKHEVLAQVSTFSVSCKGRMCKYINKDDIQNNFCTSPFLSFSSLFLVSVANNILQQ